RRGAEVLVPPWLPVPHLGGQRGSATRLRQPGLLRRLRHHRPDGRVHPRRVRHRGRRPTHLRSRAGAELRPPSLPGGLTVTTRFLAVVLLLVFTGCARKEPSPEYTRASERFNKLYAKELDDAYVDPAIHEVEALLEKVPADSLDAQAAAQLLKRIRDNRARIEQAASDRDKALAAARGGPTFSGPSVSPPPLPPQTARTPPPPDAG